MWNKHIRSLEQGTERIKQFLNSEKGNRLAGLVLICLTAFSSSITSSVYLLITGDYRQRDELAKTFSFTDFIVFELTLIFLLIYILHLQKRRLKTLGFSFAKRDFLRAFLLCLKAFILLIAFAAFVAVIYWIITGQNLSLRTDERSLEGFRTSKVIFLFILATVNPFFEELIVRAYLMTEIEYLTGNINIAIFFSVLIQTSYHYYRGAITPLFMSIIFLVYAFYYSKNRNIMPVILSHMYFDFIGLIAINAR